MQTANDMLIARRSNPTTPGATRRAANKQFRVAARLALKLEELGVPVPTVLRHAGLPVDLFSQTRVLVSTGELFALWGAIGEVSPDPALGLKLGTESRIERFHPSGIACLSTENFGAAISHMARYKQLTCPEEISQQIDSQEWSIHFRWLLAGDVEPRILIDYCFAWILTIGRHGIGNWTADGTCLSPLRLELVQPRSYARQMERHFGCPVVTGAARNAIIFRAADASLPFITRNTELLDMLAPQFDAELQQGSKQQDGSQHSFVELVRGAIQHRLTGHRPSVDDVARDLHISTRTLQRRLLEAGSNYQNVLDTARHQMARYYLRSSVLELNEAAYLLGYEDSNSFVRAFRTWEGVPPGAWRESHRASAAPS